MIDYVDDNNLGEVFQRLDVFDQIWILIKLNY